MILTRIAKIAGFIVVGAVVLAGLVFAGIETPWFRTWAKGQGERAANRFLRGELTIGSLDGNLLTGAQLSDVTIRMDNRDVVKADHIYVRYALRNLISKKMVLDEVRLVKPVVTLIETESGWNVASMLKPRQPPTKPSERGIAIDAIRITDGIVGIERRGEAKTVVTPRRIEQLNAELTFSYAANDLSFASRKTISFEAFEPRLSVHELSGGVVFRDRRLRLDRVSLRTGQSRLFADIRYEPRAQPAKLSGRFEAEPAAFDELKALVPALERYRITPTIKATLDGSIEALKVVLSMDDPGAGVINGDVVLDLDAPARGVKGTFTTRSLDVVPIFGDPRFKSSLTTTGSVDIDASRGWGLSVLGGTFQLAGNTIDFWGYHADRLKASGRFRDGRVLATATGQGYEAAFTTDANLPLGGSKPFSYSLRGRATGVNLLRMPQNLKPPPLESDLDVQYVIAGNRTRSEGDVTFGASTVEGAIIEPGGTGHFVLGGGPPHYAFDGDIRGVDVERVGRALEITAISDDRFSGDLNGHFTVDGSGARLSELALRASGQLTPSRILYSDVPQLSFDLAIDDEQMRVSGRGSVRTLDLARLRLTDRASGSINASFDVSGGIDRLGQPLSVDSIDGTGTVTVEQSKIGGLAVDKADFIGSYADRVARFDRFELVGPAVNVSASGLLSLGTAEQSALKYSADLGKLEQLGELIGHALSGSATASGEVTGNADRLVASGPVQLTRFHYEQSVDALATEGQYTVTVSNLDANQLSIEASIESSLVTLMGQSVTTASFKAEYVKPALSFDSTFRRGGQTATAAGRAVLHPERQEVHLDRLSLGSGDIVWSSPAGGPNLDIEYGKGLVRLENVRLESGTEQLVAKGTIALSGDQSGDLDVKLENVDLERLGSLLLVQRKWGGRLDATARVTGTAAARNVKGEAAVRAGAVDNFKFEALDAVVNYAGNRAHVDATLRQQPGVQLVATGDVPVTRGAGGTSDGASGLNLHIESTSIDLSVVQALTTQLTRASGILQVKADVTGSLAAPRVEGNLQVQNGVFEVVSTGVEYRQLNTQVRFQGDSVIVDQLDVQDDDGHRMTVTGRVGVEGRRIGDVELTVQARDFRVLNNDIGDVELNAAATITGSLAASKVEGRLRVDSGRIEVDTLLERLTANPYSTSPQRVQADAAPERAEGLFENLVLDLDIEVPDNLVLRGNGIKSVNGPTLGNVNVTVGGTFKVSKERGLSPQLLGTVGTVRGTYEFQARRFTVVRDGTIDFRGGRPIDPALNVVAERDTAGVIVRVNIQGTARNPRLTLSSDPPLEETDILSLIVFNQPASQLTEGDRVSLSERATALASGAVVGTLTESLGRALNLSIFEVETVTEAGGGPSVTVGKQVGERLFVRIREQFGSQDVTELSLEYQLLDFLRAEGSVSDGQGLTNRSLTRRVERAGLNVVIFLKY